jgi:hypothetical protein
MTRAMLATSLAVLLALPPLAQWFSATMPRHQLIQVPALLVLGAVAARQGSSSGSGRPAGDRGPALLVLAIGILMFWMVPRSVDLAASNAAADQLQHVSSFLAGAGFARTLPALSVVTTMALGIHGVAMLAAQGLVYTLYPGLICTAYTLQQQLTTGRFLLYAAPMLGLGLWGWVLRRMAAPTTMSASTAKPPSPLAITE